MPDLPHSPPITDERLLAGRYRLVRLVARGGMAEVWEAMDEVLARPVAVKLLHGHLAADAAFVARFKREAVAAARLSHPNIVSIYDTCSDGDTEAIVMELVRGRTLREVLDVDGSLPAARAAWVAALDADALDCAHRSGLVHRDVKPAIVLLTDDGRVLVADFGIAKAVQEDAGDLTATGSVVGTAKYLAPEQVTGGVIDGRTDVYALGVVLYEMLTGRPPFEAESQLATAVMRLNNEPLTPRQRRAGIPRRLEEIVLKAMAREPSRRYAGAAELRSDLLGVDLGDDVDRTSAIARPEPHGGSRREPRFADTERSWLVPTALILLVAASLGITGVLLVRTEVGRSIFEGARDAVGGEPAESPTQPAAISSLASFDPDGDGGEHDDELSFLTDGDPSTTWSTERYKSRADFQGLKDGVGVILTLDRATELGVLEVESPTSDWAASVYVADGAADDIAGWGQPVAEQSGIDGIASFDLGDAQGRAVLLWITDIGSGSPPAAEIGEIRLTG